MATKLRLSEICFFERGLTYAKGDEVSKSNNVVLRANNITLETNELNFEDLKYLNDSVDIKANKILRKGSVLICTASGSKSHLGKVAFVGEELGYSFGGFMAQITPLPKVLPRFLYFLLISPRFKKHLQNLSDGTNINNLKFSDIENFEFEIPSLLRQQELISVLEESMTLVAEFEKSTNKKLMLATEFLETQTAERVKAVEKIYGAASMGELFVVARGGSPRPIKSFLTQEADGVNWVKIGDATRQGKYIASTKDKIKPSGVSRSRRVSSGDLLLSNSMSFGRPYIMQTDGCIHDGWVVLTARGDVDSEYAYYVLGSSYMKNQFELLAQGSTVRNLNIDLISRAVMPVPSLQEQRRLVEEFQSTEKYVAAYVAKQHDMKSIVADYRAVKMASVLEGSDVGGIERS
jgi:restriction endonuclease S subunit